MQNKGLPFHLCMTTYFGFVHPLPVSTLPLLSLLLVPYFSLCVLNVPSTSNLLLHLFIFCQVVKAQVLTCTSQRAWMPSASQRVYLMGGRDEVSADTEVLNLFTNSDMTLQVAVALAKNLNSLVPERHLHLPCETGAPAHHRRWLRMLFSCHGPWLTDSTP